MLRRSTIGQRRNTQLHPSFQTRIGLYAAPVQTQLTLAAHFLDHALCDLRKLALQKTVKALVAVIFFNDNRLNAAHAHNPLAMARPAINPKIDRPTESPI